MRTKKKASGENGSPRKKDLTWKSYLYVALASVGVFFLMLLVEGMFSGKATDLRTFLRILSDACLIPGTILLCIGGGVCFYGHGAFDGFVYLSKLVTGKLSRNKLRQEHVQTFAEFVEERDSKDQVPCRHFVLTGCVFYFFCILFLVWNISL